MNAKAKTRSPEKHDPQGRLIRFKTKRGTAIFRPYDKRNGQKIFRDYFMFKVMVLGRRYYFPVGSEKDKAGGLADDIAAFLDVPGNTVHAAIEKFLPERTAPKVNGEKYPTVGELIETYNRVANKVTDRTRKECSGALRRVAAFILGLKPFKSTGSKERLQAWREKVDALPVTLITPEKLESLRGSLIRGAKTDEIKKGKAIVTANAIIRNAGCLFTPRMRLLYTSFMLPSPDPFKTVGQIEERPHRYVSKVDIQAIVQAARNELAEKHPAEYVVFVLSLFGGLRRGEIDRLIWDQIDFEKEHIWIRTTPYFRPKAFNSESRVDCRSDVFEILRKFKPHSITPPFVVPGADPENKIRCRPVFSYLYTWLRQKGIQEVKALHLLRKEAGSHIFAASGSTDKAAEFLRNDPRTAREYYLGRKDRLEVHIGGLAA